MAPINNTDIKLMLAMIGTVENLKTDNEKLAGLVGGGTTANAIRQRVVKIKKQATAVVNGEEFETKTAETPSKTKAAPAIKRKSSDDDSEVAGSTATPKRKRNTKKTAKEAEVTHEENDEEAAVKDKDEKAAVENDGEA